jgi:hypothetical protein
MRQFLFFQAAVGGFVSNFFEASRRDVLSVVFFDANFSKGMRLIEARARSKTTLVSSAHFLFWAMAKRDFHSKFTQTVLFGARKLVRFFARRRGNATSFSVRRIVERALFFSFHRTRYRMIQIDLERNQWNAVSASNEVRIVWLNWVIDSR